MKSLAATLFVSATAVWSTGSVFAQSDALTGRTDYRIQLYETNAIGTSIPQPAGMAIFSGNIGAATNELAASTNVVRPNDTQGIYLLASAIGQPVGISVVPFNMLTNGSGAVTTTPRPVSDWFQLSQSISLAATPGRYHAFTRWSDGNTNNPRQVVAGPTNGYTAVFTNMEALETNIAGFDRVAPVGTPIILLNGQFYPHDVVPVADPSQQFSVTLLTSYTNGSIHYTTNGDAPSTTVGFLYTGTFTVAAPFKIQARAYQQDNSNPRLADQVNSLVVNSPGGGGAVVTPQTDLYDGSASAVLTATNQAGWAFLNWTNDSNTTVPILTLAMDQPKSVQAIFGTAVAPAVTGDGYVTNLPPQALYAYGSLVRLGALAAPGNYFDTWSGAVSSSRNPLEFAVTNANPSIIGGFLSSDGKQSLTVLTLGEGDVSNSPPGNVYSPGANIILTAIPRPGQSFVGWSGDATGSSTNLGVMMTGNKVIYASFAVTQPLFALSATNYSVDESDGAVAITVVNRGAFGTNVSFGTADGSAIGGTVPTSDYTPTNTALTFASGPASQTIYIPIRNKFLQAADKTFQINLSNPGTGGSIGTPSSATVTIRYNARVSTNGSELVQAFPSAVPDHSGSLRVTITGTQPTTSGGFWRFPWELGWRGSGVLVTNLMPDDYPVEFRPFTGYSILPLNPHEGFVFANAPTDITRQYAASGIGVTGQLTVNLGPNTPIVNTDAAWRLVGETNWLSSGTTLGGLAQSDNYLVECKPVTGLTTPATREVAVFANQLNAISVYYEPAGSLPNVALPNPLLSLSSIVGSVTNYPRLPYAFNGQLKSDIGFGSGVAARPHTVLTAAHLVFNDAVLGYVSQVYWFFQQHTPEFDPKPQTARGWYVLSGYASARTNDLTVNTNDYSPGVSSPGSRNTDVAVLYFTSAAARDGFGGYLASDATTNEWLTSTNPKMLVGYPLDGTSLSYTNIIAGKMHAISANNYAFTRQNDRAYASPDLLSFPGNSGGPLYVLHTNGIFYPAAVYLGTIAAGSAVRAIDSDVVNLLNLAENSATTGDGGTNFTGGGVVRWIPGNGTSFNPGLLTVKFSPSNIVELGAAWRVQDSTNLTWINDTNLYYPLTPGAFNIEFHPVNGYSAPAVRTVNLVANQTTEIEAHYSLISIGQVQLLANGNLRMTLGGAAGQVYYLQASSNLVNWMDVRLLTNASGALVFTNAPLPGPPAGFFRVRE